MDKPQIAVSPQPVPAATPQPTPIPQPSPTTTPVSPVPSAPSLQTQFSLDWLVRQKPYMLLSALRSGGEQNISNLAKKSGMSYVHAIEMLKMLEERGILTTELKGNKRMIRLTEGGTAFVFALEELVKKAPQKK